MHLVATNLKQKRRQVLDAEGGCIYDYELRLSCNRVASKITGNRSQSLQLKRSGCRNLLIKGKVLLVPMEKGSRRSSSLRALLNNGNRLGYAPRKRLPAQRDRKAREHALIASAAKLFASRGYDLTTTREIAARAGCSEGLIHRYFQGKAGLLFALIQSRVSKEVEDLNSGLRRADTLEKEFLQLVDWEVDRMWQDRDFLRVIVPRALLDPAQGKLLSKVGSSRHEPAITERLAQFPQCRHFSQEELADLAEFIKALGMIYGFMQPMVLRHARSRARRTAASIAKLLVCRL